MGPVAAKMTSSISLGKLPPRTCAMSESSSASAASWWLHDDQQKSLSGRANRLRIAEFE